MSDDLNFPLLIRAVRLHLQESQEVFAKRFKSHANTVSRWENGEYQAPYTVINFIMKRHWRLEKLTCPVCNGKGVL